MENNEIRFIDSHYNLLFKIPDNSSITVTYPDGHTEDKFCKYIDDYHTYIDGNCYHICQWAELMEQNGNTCTSAEKPEYVLEPIEQSEFEFMYSSVNKSVDRGCIGHLRADFDTGKSFFHSWWAENDSLKTPEFVEEFDKVIEYFRKKSSTPLFKSRSDMYNVCYRLKPMAYEGNHEIKGFKVQTDKHTYYLRCNPRLGEYNLYLYAYNKEMLTKYRDLQFVEKNYAEIDKDKFYINNDCVMEMYYNPDANAGGQLVEITFYKEDIKDAARLYKKPDDFFSYLEGMAKGSLYDVGTGTFRETAEHFMESKADFEGGTKETMEALKKFAGIEPEKKHKKTEPER